MVATVQLTEYNGTDGSETGTNKNSGTIRFKNADNATVDTNDPLVIPASDTEYSFEKMLEFNVTVAPDTNLTNLEAYTDGANGFGTGVKAWYKNLGGDAGTGYATPGAPTETNDPPHLPVNNSPSATGVMDLFTATSGSPIDMGAGPHTGTGRKGNTLDLVMEVETNATQGTTPGETLTFAYDEI